MSKKDNAEDIVDFTSLESNESPAVALTRLSSFLNRKLSWVELIIRRRSSVFCNQKFLDVPKQEFIAVTQQKIIHSFVTEVLHQELIKVFHLSKEQHQSFKVDISNFVARVLREVICNPVCDVVSLLYFQRFLKEFPENRLGLNNWKFYYGMCVILSCKMWEDRVYTNMTYLRDLGFQEALTLDIFNLMERTVLKVLDFKLLVTYEAFKEFLKEKATTSTVLEIRSYLQSNLFEECFYVEKKEAPSEYEGPISAQIESTFESEKNPNPIT